MAWRPTVQHTAEILRGLNPWHEMGRVPAEFAKPNERALGASLHRALIREHVRYQLILGPRRVGKTTVMHQTAERLIRGGIAPTNIWWLTMNVPHLMQHPLDEWVGICRSGRSPEEVQYFFIDEINYADKWDLWLKAFYDMKLPIRIAATSSSTAALRNRFVESGVGRWEEQHLSPCSFAEYLDLIGRSERHVAGNSLRESLRAATDGVKVEQAKPEDLSRFLLVGGFPELIINPPQADLESEILRSQHVLRSDALQRAVAMDIPQVFNINEPVKLERMLYLLAGQIGGVVSPAKLSQELSLSLQTVQQYLGYLERAFLIIMLPNYGGSEEAIQRRGRKVYFADGALRSAALYRGIAPLRDPAELGELMENAAASHLHALSLQTGVRVFHWREREHEVDCVYDDPSGPVAVEITASRRHPTSGLLAFIERFPKFKGGAYLVSTSESMISPEKSENGIGRIPVRNFLLACGHLEAMWLDQRVGR